MEITKDQPLNIFGKYHVPTQPMRILTHLFMIVGVVLIVWLIQSHKAVRLSPSPADPASKIGHGWSLDLTGKE